MRLPPQRTIDIIHGSVYNVNAPNNITMYDDALRFTQLLGR